MLNFRTDLEGRSTTGTEIPGHRRDEARTTTTRLLEHLHDLRLPSTVAAMQRPGRQPVTQCGAVGDGCRRGILRGMDASNPVVRLCAEGMDLERAGRRDEAARAFTLAWERSRDDYDRCIAAHYLARAQSNP